MEVEIRDNRRGKEPLFEGVLFNQVRAEKGKGVNSDSELRISNVRRLVTDEDLNNEFNGYRSGGDYQGIQDKQIR